MANWQRLQETRANVSEKNPTKTLRYIVLGASDTDEIDEDVRSVANTPGTFEGLTRMDYSADEQGGGVYFVDVEYGVPTAENPALGDTPLVDQVAPEAAPPFDGQGDDGNPPDTDSGPSQTGNDNDQLGPEYSFEITGKTVKVLQSIATVEGYGINGVKLSTHPLIVPNYKQAINVRGGADGGIDGVELGSSSGGFRWTYTARFRFITRAYLRTLAELAGTVNDATYFGFASGESLFYSASGNYEKSSASPWKISFAFEIARNETDIVIHGALGAPATSLIVAAKRGHDYLWCVYGDKILPGKVAPLAEFAYVEQVYKYKNHKLLGI